MEKPSTTMPLGYAGVVMGFFIDIFYFKEDFNWLMIIGIVLTSVGLLSKWCLHEEDKSTNNGIKQDK